VTDLEKGSPDPIRELESAGWPEVVDRLIFRVCHDLNGRISALSHLAFLVEAGEECPDFIARTLEGEVDRLSQLVGLLESLPDLGVRQEEAINLSELATTLAHFMNRQAGLDGVRISAMTIGDPPPVLMDRTVLSRSLALLLTHAAAECRRSGGKGLEAVVSEKDEGVLLTLGGDLTFPTRREAAPELVAGEAPFSREELLELVAGVLERSGGRLEGTAQGRPGSTSLRIWLPSLAQARNGA
jgi:hypothetical protein